MKTTENTTTTIMTEKAMKKKINDIIEKLNNLRVGIGMLEITTVDDEPLDGTGVHELPEHACEWLEETIKELSGDDCLSRLDYVSDNTISMVYSNIEDYIDKTEDFVPEDCLDDLHDARIILSIIEEIWDEINDIGWYSYQLAHAES